MRSHSQDGWSGQQNIPRNFIHSQEVCWGPWKIFGPTAKQSTYRAAWDTTRKVWSDSRRLGRYPTLQKRTVRSNFREASLEADRFKNWSTEGRNLYIFGNTEVRQVQSYYGVGRRAKENRQGSAYTIFWDSSEPKEESASLDSVKGVKLQLGRSLRSLNFVDQRDTFDSSRDLSCLLIDDKSSVR